MVQGRSPAYRGSAHIVFEDFAFGQFGNQFAINFEFVVAVASTSALTRQPTQVSKTGETSGYAGGLLEPSTDLIIFSLNDSSALTYGVAAIDPYSRSVVWQTDGNGYKNYKLITIKPKLVSTGTGFIVVPGELVVAVGGNLEDKKILRLDAVSGAVLDTSPAKATGSAEITALAYDWISTKPDFQPYYIVSGGAIAGYGLGYGFDTNTDVDPPLTWYIGSAMISSGEGTLLVKLQDADISPTVIAAAIYDTESEAWTTPVTVGGFDAAVYADGYFWVLPDDSTPTLKQIDASDGTLTDTIDFSADYSISDSIGVGDSPSGMDGLVYDLKQIQFFFKVD